MAVVGGTPAVEADADADPLVEEEVGVLGAEGTAEPHGVGLDRQLHVGDGRDRALELADETAQPVRREEQGLSAVQNDADEGNLVALRVTGDGLGGGRFHDLRGHRPRLFAPALVRCLVDVAMVAGQVAAALNLQDELAEQRTRHP